MTPIHEAYDGSEDARRYVEWRSRNVFRRASKRFEAWRVRRLLGPAPARILDVACGGGRFDAFVACDRARGMARLARANGGRAVLGDAFALPFRTGAFGAALCVRFLHHFERTERVRALVELRRVARVAVVTYFGATGLKAKRRTRSKRRTRRSVHRTEFARDCAAAAWRVVRDVAVLPGWSEQRIARLESD